MKIPSLTIVSLFVATASLQAAPSYLAAKVTGTAETQIVNGPSDGRISVSKVDNKRIFTEFQVSATDYELAFSTSGSVGLYLVPKHTSAALPTITVLVTGGDSQTVIDTKAHSFGYESDLDAGTANNLFKNLGGTLIGTFKYSGAFPPTAFSSGVLTLNGHGTSTSVSGGTAILQLKITAKGAFTPVP